MQWFMKGMEASATSSASLPAAKDSVRKCKVMVPAKALALREEAYRIPGSRPDYDPRNQRLACSDYSGRVGRWHLKIP
jgi:hypothetical protein